jgi:serine/threonine-protein kinase
MGVEGEGLQGWPLVAGTALGKYQVVRLIGEGGMGAVYEGLHVEIGKRVAIKAMNPVLAAIPEARARFVREAQLTSRVRHPHIVDVTDIGTDAGRPFLVMEYLEGDDLAKHIHRRGPLPLDEVVDIVLPVLAAVAVAHDEGIVHRDLKPQNLFLAQMRDGTTHPMVLDFGISKAPPQFEGEPITTANGLLGSPGYFAPEQVDDGRAASAASDQYALGVILYECVTGRLPYEGASLASLLQSILRGRYFPARTHRPDLPEAFQAVIARAMAIDPGARYPGLRDMGRALLAFASEKSRLLWEGPFLSEPIVVAPPARVRAPTPVTDQMPAAVPVSRSVTASLAVPEARPRAADGVASASAMPLSIPRRSLLPWALGGAALAATGVLAALAFHGRGAATGTAPVAAPARAIDRRPVAPPEATAPVPAAPPARAAAPDGPRFEHDDRTVATPRRGRPARGPRFGPNRAPLIE